MTNLDLARTCWIPRPRRLRFLRHDVADPIISLNNDTTCTYCGCALDSRVYFCPQCAKPYCHVECLLPASLPAYEDIETNLRTKAAPAWTLFFSYMCVIGVGSFIALAIWGPNNPEPAEIALGFAILVTTLVFLARFWSEVRPFLSRTAIFHPATWLGLAILAPMLLLNYSYMHFLIDTLGLKNRNTMAYFSTSWGPLVFVCIMPAIIEEIGFRGIIQHQFEKAVSPWAAIAVASLVFSAAHFTILSAPYLALLGGLLGWMKWKTGSLYPSMLVHFLHNFIVITYF